MRNFMLVRNIVSYIGVFTLIVAMVNIALSLLVYFIFPSLIDEFWDLRWGISVGIVLFGLMTEKIKIGF